MVALYLPSEFREPDDDATPEEEAAALTARLREPVVVVNEEARVGVRPSGKIRMMIQLNQIEPLAASRPKRRAYLCGHAAGRQKGTRNPGHQAKQQASPLPGV